jgi:hypothetical protein
MAQALFNTCVRLGDKHVPSTNIASPPQSQAISLCKHQSSVSKACQLPDCDTDCPIPPPPPVAHCTGAAGGSAGGLLLLLLLLLLLCRQCRLQLVWVIACICVTVRMW